jgi:hypothetical protein
LPCPLVSNRMEFGALVTTDIATRHGKQHDYAET